MQEWCEAEAEAEASDGTDAPHAPDPEALTTGPGPDAAADTTSASTAVGREVVRLDIDRLVGGGAAPTARP
ncbi:hypothetical protein [Streptomyces sp. LN699]|uniref:hypothetical protein n=1 Tax=Streptomyces sp. LN699 TaxID=3112981 RepID=UPI00371CB4C7